MSHDDVRSECDSVRCGELDVNGLKCSLQVCQTCITKECPVDQAEQVKIDIHVGRFMQKNCVTV